MHNFYDWVIIFLAEYLLYFVVLGVFLFFIFDKNRARAKLAIIHSFLAGVLARFVFAEIIRFFYDRPRPFTALSGVHRLINEVPGHAFPSGHASFSFAIAMAAYYYYPKTSILFFLASLANGFGRVAAGVHWPSDILGGAVVGIFSAWLIEILLKNFARGGS